MSSRTVIRRIAGDWATGGSTSGSIGGGGGGGVTTNVEVRGRSQITLPSFETFLTTFKGCLISEGILTLVSLPTKGAKSLS